MINYCDCVVWNNFNAKSKILYAIDLFKKKKYFPVPLINKTCIILVRLVIPTLNTSSLFGKYRSVVHDVNLIYFPLETFNLCLDVWLIIMINGQRFACVTHIGCYMFTILRLMLRFNVFPTICCNIQT